MADELFMTYLGDEYDPSEFEVTAGNGYAIGWNNDAGKAISRSVNAWFLGGTTVYEYSGQIFLSVTPTASSQFVTVITAIPASTGGWKMGGAGVWGSSIPTATETPAPPEPTGFYLGGGAAAGEAEVVSTIPAANVIVSEGGFVFCGAGATGSAATSLPTSEVIVSEGGFKFNGAGVWGQVRPGDLPAAVIESSGGFVLSGSGFYADPAVTPTDTEIVSAGGWKLGGWAPDRVTVTYPADVDRVIVSSGGWALGGDEGVWRSSVPAATVIESQGALFLIGGGGLATSESPPIAVITGDALGGFELGGGGLADPAEVFETFILNGMAFEPSVWSNFPFNSFASKDGKAYAAGDSGIYVLEGEHDAGEPIRSGARIGPVNLGTDGEKRLRGINFGDGGPGTRVRVRVETGEEVYAPERDDNRVVVSRNIQGRTFEIDIMEFIELSHLEITPLKLARR